MQHVASLFTHGRLVHALVDHASRIASAVEAWRSSRRTRALLHGLDDNGLKDIGLARSEIASVSWLGGGDGTRRLR